MYILPHDVCVNLRGLSLPMVISFVARRKIARETMKELRCVELFSDLWLCAYLQNNMLLPFHCDLDSH